jgi:hypothetical protein
MKGAAIFRSQNVKIFSGLVFMVILKFQNANLYVRGGNKKMQIPSCPRHI